MILRRVCITLIVLVISTNVFSQRNSYVCFIDGSLYKMNVLQCDTQYLGTSIFLADIAVTPSGNLYGTDFYKLYKVDTLNAAVSYIADIDSVGGGFNSLVALDDTYLLGVRNSSDLYKINALTGNTQLVGWCGYSPAGDITFYKGYFFLSAAFSGDLIKIKLNDDCSSILSVEDIGAMHTGSASIEPYGVLTTGDAACSYDNIKLFAFDGYDVYDVNPDNAFCTLYCASINVVGALGATSLAEVEFQGYDDLLDMPNIFTPNEDGINDYFSLKKSYGIFNVSFQVFDRWGINVYSSNSNELKWDGKNKAGLDCNAGTYYYLIQYTNYCNKEFTKKGFVQLIR